MALLGYMKSGVYEIDIDGNGPHPPAHVRCEFEAHSGVRKTVVEHNLPRDAVSLNTPRNQTSNDMTTQMKLMNRKFEAGVWTMLSSI